MKACGLTREEARAAQRYMDANAHKLGKGNQAGMMKLFHEARDHVRPPPPDPQHILEAMGVDATTPVDATPPDALQGLFGVSLAALSLEHRGVDLGVSESVTVMLDLPGHGIELTADMASPELRQALITGDFSAYDFPNGEEDEDG